MLVTLIFFAKYLIWTEDNISSVLITNFQNKNKFKTYLKNSSVNYYLLLIEYSSPTAFCYQLKTKNNMGLWLF